MFSTQEIQKQIPSMKKQKMRLTFEDCVLNPRKHMTSDFPPYPSLLAGKCSFILESKLFQKIDNRNGFI